jgi:hypothetical protein
MRTAKRVKQKLYYSLYTDGEPIYERDSEGNIIYDTMPDGEQVPRVIGESSIGYQTPVEFFNSITGELTVEELQAFGDEPKMKAKMTYKKGEYPFAVGTLIWHNSEPEVNEGQVNPDSADYRVVGIQDTGRHFYKALLVKIV